MEKPSTAPKPSITTTPPPAPSSGTLSIREVEPETYYMLKDGELFPVLMNVPFEEIGRLLEILRNLKNPDPPEPTHTIQQLLITGTASGEKAELSVTVTIRLLRDGLMRVPLGFAGAHLRELPTYDGDGEPVVLRDKDAGGLICWIQAPKEKTCSLSMKLIAPLRKVGRETRLMLQTPQAPSSELSLRVPVPFSEVRAEATNGDLVRREEGEGSLLVVTGIAGTGGNTQVTWRKGSREPTSPQPLLQVRSETLVTIEELEQVTSHVTLHVSSLRGDFDYFSIRLPADSRPFRMHSSQSSVQFTESVDGADETKAKIVQVKLDSRTTGPVDVELGMDLTREGSGNIAEFEAGGIEVEEARRQSGEINVVVKGDLSVKSVPGRNVQRTLVPDSWREKKVSAHFQYNGPSPSLRIQVSKETQVSVEPIYVLHVESNRVVLDATLKYKIRGADVSDVNVNLRGWEFGGISPDTLVDDEGLDRENLAPLRIPLTPAAMTESGEFELRISAVQPIPDTATSVSVSLPRPDAKMLTPATVVVLAADNVELTVEDDALKGLEPESFPPEVMLPPRQQPPMYFRERSDATTTAFAPGIRVRQRAVSVRSVSELEVDLLRARIEQRIEYRIAYEPLRNVQLIVPRSVRDKGDLRILYEDQALPLSEVLDEAGDDQDTAPAQDAPALIQVDLLAERNGPCDLIVEYELPLSELPVGPGTSAQIPLVIPAAAADTTFTGSTLHVLAGENVQVGAEDGNWEVVVEDAAEDAAARDSDLTLISKAIPSSATLRVMPSDRRRRTSTVISQAWIQTWLNSAVRRERAVFRVTTDENRIEIHLPEQAEVKHVALDGHRVPVPASGAEPIAIELDDVTSPAEHVVELWYWLPRLRQSLGAVAMEAPIIADAKWAKRLYWQLATPPDEHLLHTPVGMTPELSWKWQGLFWARSARLQQSDLENLMGASPQTPVPEALNQYLFSSFGEIANPECTTAARRDILLTLGGFALVAGLMLIYVPALRHPGLLFAGGVVLLGVMLRYPELSIGLVQASCLGLASILGACLLKWAVDAHEVRRSSVRGASYTSPDSNTVRAAIPPLDSSSFPTTVAAPAPGQASAEESKT